MMARYSPCSQFEIDALEERRPIRRKALAQGFEPQNRRISRGSAVELDEAHTPSPSSSVDSDHRLDLQEIAQSELAPLAAVARHLEAAERRVHVAGGAVQGDLAGADAIAPMRRACRLSLDQT